MKPSPRHSKWGRSSNTSAIASSAAVALVGHHARVLVLDLAAALAELAQDHQIAWSTSSGSKPATTSGLP